jgi:hypothetical protein
MIIYVLLGVRLPATHVRMKRNPCGILVCELEGKRPTVSRMCKWECNIKVDQ